MRKLLLSSLVMVAATHAVAAPYTGSGIACTPSDTPSTCKIDILDFMKSKFNHTMGSTYTSDSTNLAAAANTAATSSLRYIRKAGSLHYEYATDTVTTASSDVTVRQGFMNHPTLPNLLMHSKTGSNTAQGGAIEYFRWAGGKDNAVYVLSEPVYAFPGTDVYGYRSFEQTEPAPNMQWRHRGYFWSDKEFDVTRNADNPNEWVSAVRTWGGSHHHQVSQSSGKFGPMAVGTAPNSVVLKYYPAENGAWINAGGGQLPSTPLEVLRLVLRKHDPATGNVTWWESYDYARQKLADGSYNYFGMIRFLSSIDYYANPRAPRCHAGVAPTPNAKCGELDFVIENESHYNAFATAAEVGSTVQKWYQTALQAPNKAMNDPKLTKRANSEDLYLPPNRGGFVPPGNGSDAKGAYVAGAATAPPGDMLYLENMTVEQDWYVYPNGKDPLFAPAASPTNYCRDGYKYLASFPTARSYNGLTGATENTGALHWVVVCGTSTDAYFHGSNGNSEASCSPGYISRGWWGNPNHLTFSTCYPDGSCTDQAAKQYINMCVSGSETQLTFPAPNP